MPEDTVRGLIPGQQLFGRYVARQFVKRSERNELWIAEDRHGGQWVQLLVWPQAIKADRFRYSRLKVGLTRAMQLDHPNVVRVFDLLDDGQNTVLVMEAPAGRTWEQMLRERRPRPFEPSELAPVIGPLCEVLDHAWNTLNLAHGCIRPSQVVICPDGSLKLQGFGLSPSISQNGESAFWQEGIEEVLVYLSPQQLRGEEPGPRDDVYGLGMSLYRMIVGRPPYLVRRIADALRQPDPPPLSDQRMALGIEGAPIPPDWERVVLDCVTRDAARRPLVAGDVARRLSGRVVPAGPPEPAAMPSILPQAGPQSAAAGAGTLQDALTRRLPPPSQAEAAEPRKSPFQAPLSGMGETGIPVFQPQPPAARIVTTSPVIRETPMPVPQPPAAASQPGPIIAARSLASGEAMDAPRPRLTPPPARDPAAEARQESLKRIHRHDRKGRSKFAAVVVAVAGLLCMTGIVVQMVGIDRVKGLLGVAAQRGAPAAAATAEPTHMAAGEALFGEAKFEAALSEFSLALQQGGDKADVLCWRGRCYLALQKLDGAITEFTSALEAKPGHGMSHLFRGYALAKGSRLGEALEDFNMAIAADPTLIDAYHHRGSVLLELGRYERALEDLNKVVKAKPGFAVYYDRGLAHFHMNNFAESLSDFDQAILQDANYPPAYYNRGSVYFQTGRFREAVRDFGEAIRLNPRYENAYYMRGVASHRLGDHVRAIEDLSESIRLRLDFREAWEQRGFARLAAGDYHKANEDFEQARKLASAAGLPASQASPAGSAAGGGTTPTPIPAAPPASGFNAGPRLLDPKVGESAVPSTAPRP